MQLLRTWWWSRPLAVVVFAIVAGTAMSGSRAHPLPRPGRLYSRSQQGAAVLPPGREGAGPDSPRDASPTSLPPGREGAGLAYDDANSSLVLFGGTSLNDAGLNDTWTWNGSAWTEQHPATSPPSVPGSTMTYDEARGVAVLFDRRTTWTWDGQDWTRQQSAGSPPGEFGEAMTYDAARKVVVLLACDLTPAIRPDRRWLWHKEGDAAGGEVRRIS